MQVIVLDTETTGLKEPVPVEVAYIALQDESMSDLFLGYRIVDDMVVEYRQLFDPLKPIEFGAMATHHITHEDVEGCPPYLDFQLPQSIEYMIGHSIDFDWQVIQSCGEQPEVKRICTLAIARHLYPDVDSHKLTAMLYALDYQYARDHAKGAHSALDDVWMTLRLLEVMLPKIGAKNFEELYQFSEMARIPTVITFGKHSGQPIKSLPSDYRQWLLKQNDLDLYLRKALTQERK